MCVVRTCVGCRERAVADGLLRVVVVSRAGGLTVVPDNPRRLAGRGASLHLDLACLALAERRRAFLRAFRVRGPLDLTVLHEYFEQQLHGTAGEPRTPSTERQPGSLPGTSRRQVDTDEHSMKSKR